MRIRTINVDGVNLFYREAGSPTAPVFLLLHGFPSSSFQYRNLIPLLAAKYHVLAPDLPGFGFTEVPEQRKYTYTFESFKNTVKAFLDKLGVEKFAMYVFDYGAPTGFRLALERPDAVTAFVSQNGNAYVEGLGSFWDGVKKYWEDPKAENREALQWLTGFDATKFQYVTGAPDANVLAPEAWHLDAALLARPGNDAIQLDIFYDYRKNVELYSQFQKFFREKQPRALIIWGKNDPIFIPPGAEAFKRDLPHATVKLVDGGHFALESHLEEIANEILKAF
jgi:pimeloyl-ACP methyl ester carboxylesterase